MRSKYDTDFTIVNGGMLRANAVYEKGPMKMSFVSYYMFPKITMTQFA